MAVNRRIAPDAGQYQEPREAKEKPHEDPQVASGALAGKNSKQIKSHSVRLWELPL